MYPEVEVKISPDISGEITELNVQEGDSVKKGEVLARIYADIYSSQNVMKLLQEWHNRQATVANSEAPAGFESTVRPGQNGLRPQ